MKSKNVKNQKIRLIAAAALCFFSVAAVVTATVAWFTAFRKSEDDNSDMVITNLSGYFSRMDIYQLTRVKDEHDNVTITGLIYDTTPKQLHFEKTPIAYAYVDEDEKMQYSPNFNVDMDPYSGLEQHSPLLMIFTLTGNITATDDKPVTVYAACDKDYYFGEKNPATGDPKHEIQREDNPLSSVVAFYTKSYASLDSITTQDYYNLPFAELEPSSGFDMETFVSFSGSEYQSFTQKKNIFEARSGTFRYIVVIVDYYYYALEYVYNTFIGADVLEDMIYFYCDWNMVI